MTILYSDMDGKTLTAEAPKVVGQIKGSKNGLGRYTYAIFTHAIKHSDGDIIANLYKLLKADECNASYLRAIRHASIDCTGFVITASNNKTEGLKVTSKRDGAAWALIKGDIATANMTRLLGVELDGSGISSFVNRPKIKTASKSSNDADGGNGEAKNAYATAVGSIADIMTEINNIAPNDADVMADLQTLLAMESKLKAKLLDLKSRMAKSLAKAVA